MTHTAWNMKFIPNLRDKTHLVLDSSLAEVYFGHVSNSLCYGHPSPQGVEKKATKSIYLTGTECCPKGFSRNYFRYIEAWELAVIAGTWHHCSSYIFVLVMSKINFIIQLVFFLNCQGTELELQNIIWHLFFLPKSVMSLAWSEGSQSTYSYDILEGFQDLTVIIVYILVFNFNGYLF